VVKKASCHKAAVLVSFLAEKMEFQVLVGLKNEIKIYDFLHSWTLHFLVDIQFCVCYTFELYSCCIVSMTKAN